MKNTEILLRTYACTGCGRCVEACRRGVLRLVDKGEGRVVQVADAESCAACRACERRCSAGVIAIRKIEGRKSDCKHLLRLLAPVPLALAVALPWSLDPGAWASVDYWKIFGLLVLFHILCVHIPFSKYLKKIERR